MNNSNSTTTTPTAGDKPTNGAMRAAKELATGGHLYWTTDPETAACKDAAAIIDRETGTAELLEALRVIANAPACMQSDAVFMRETARIAIARAEQSSDSLEHASSEAAPKAEGKA